MTFHPRSVVEFGLFFNRVSDSLLSGAPLEQSAELIRVQLSALAVAVRIEDRLSPGHGGVVLAEAVRGDQPEAAPLVDGDLVLSPTPREELRLAELSETCHQISATAASERDGTRYTLSVFRDLAEPGFDTEEKSVCEILVSQLRRGVELSARIGETEVERALYSTVMDRLYVGVVMLDAKGRVVKTSAIAEAALAERDGLQMQAGRLRATSATQDRELQQAVKTVLQAVAEGETPAARGLSLAKLSGNRNLGIIIQPIPCERRDGLANSAAVAIYIRDPDTNAEVEGELVRQLFDLTPAEAAVARRLAAGLSLEDAATSLDISRNTARAHLRSIFSKSGITRQTELVRLMLNSAAVLGSAPQQAA